jgi:hypothetical protein
LNEALRGEATMFTGLLILVGGLASYAMCEVLFGGGDGDDGELN